MQVSRGGLERRRSGDERPAARWPRAIGLVTLLAMFGCGEAAAPPGGTDPARAVAAGPEAAAAAASEPSRAPARVRTPEQKAAEEADADARLLARLQQVAWWNEPTMVDVLELSAELRAQLDTLLAEQLASRRSAERARRDAERELPAALLAADVELVERLRGAIADGTRRSADAELAMRARGFALLAPEQRRRIDAEYRHLAERPWIAPLRTRGRGPDDDAE
jgi:hypothetical protein